MKRYRLRLAASIAALGACAATLTAAVIMKWPLWATAGAALCATGSAIAIWTLAMAMARHVGYFAKAMEMHDFTIKMPRAHDRMVDSVNSSMNRVLAAHRDSLRALETRKLYYDRILRIMTHELRNSLTPIVTVAADITAHPGRYGAAELREGMELVHQESRAIMNFLDSYHELTHLPAPVVAATDARCFIASVQKLVDPLLKGQRCTVSYSVAQGMSLRIDAPMMRRVMVNLIKNAVEATAGADEPRVDVTVSMPGGLTHITVADNGCGMDSATLAGLFQPFFTTKPAGNGIGLCLSHQIVRLHGGDIRVSSLAGRGTEFRITLP